MKQAGRIVLAHQLRGPAAEDQTFGEALLLAKRHACYHEVAEAELRRALAHQMQDFIFRLDDRSSHAEQEISIGLAVQGQFRRVFHLLVTNQPIHRAGTQNSRGPEFFRGNTSDQT